MLFRSAKEGVAQAAMVYVADHGESLGENNLYLHGLPYAIAPDVGEDQSNRDESMWGNLHRVKRAISTRSNTK